MGRKLDFLLGRNRYLKPSKFKTLANMAISRTSILKNQHRARSSLARADVLQLLNLSYQHRAQLRVICLSFSELYSSAPSLFFFFFRMLSLMIYEWTG